MDPGLRPVTPSRASSAPSDIPFRPRRAQETVTLPQTVPRDADDRE